ncbi:NAD-dependent epimerase/dehydratase family protein [Rathayibacter sp. KR2-224]|uniref:NAD-dependent epimerase/dehydratase family protein n=1 Tax=Rathayibacter sp. KR2-224 TaxID=3400913 RepID=UPI003C0EA8A2
MAVDALIIGSRGLLGSAIVRAGEARDDWSVRSTPPLPWQDPHLVGEQVAAAVEALVVSASRAGSNWAVVWAAGAAVTSSSKEDLNAELDTFSRCVKAIRAAASTRGTFFYASSAGGAYAGSSGPPFDETTLPAPLSPYGELKLAAEAIATNELTPHGINVCIGRIANLYGPGQRLDKMQGLISHLAVAQFSPRPATIYVSLDTIRDYIYVDDCASLIADLIEEVSDSSGDAGEGVSVTKVLASGRGVTIGELIGEIGLISKRRPNVMIGFSRAAEYQARDLRLRSRVLPHLDARSLTSLPAGIAATMRDIMFRIQEPPPLDRQEPTPPLLKGQ